MGEIEIKVEHAFTVELSCNKCGSPLDGDVTRDRYGYSKIMPDPCETCLDAADEGGYARGHKDGEAEGGDDADED